MTRHHLPVACSLPLRESTDQIAEWRALSAHLMATEPVNGGYAVTFDAEVSDEVEDLARRESACCGFLEIVTSRVEGGVRLVMTSENPDALPVIEMLLGAEA